MNKQKLVLSAAALFVAMLASMSFFAGITLAAGTGPADALLITGAPAITPPGTQTWYKFEEAGNNQLVTATLDTESPSGIAFYVYTPESIGRWLSQDGLHPVGISAPAVGHDQSWQGRFQGTGTHATYYLVVHNTSQFPIEYRLNVSGNGVKSIAPPRPTQVPQLNPLATPVPVGTLSGGKIVFQQSSGGSIYTVNADGTDLKRITNGLDPAFSPDGSKIAFVREGSSPGLFIINADGTNEQNVFGGNQVRSPAWASDNQIVYSSIKRIIPGPPVCFLGSCIGGSDTVRWSLYVYDLDDESIEDVNTPLTGGNSPTTNRVLDKIAFISYQLGLMLTTLVDGAPMQIIDDDRTINTPNMSPDGSRITYMVSQPPAWQIVVAVWDGTNATLLTHTDPLVSVPPSNVAPTFSPDSQELLFLSNRNGKWEFFAINADGSNERQVLNNITDGMNIFYNYSGEARGIVGAVMYQTFAVTFLSLFFLWKALRTE